MSAFDVARLGLKRWLRVPVRQTEAYLRALKDGTFADRPVGSAAAVRPGAAGSVDRSGRGDVLVLDYALPTPDRDAGSRTVFEHVVSLVDLGHRVHFWPSDGLDVPRYAHPLRRLGVNVVAGYFRPSLKNWLAARRGTVRHVLLNRPEVAEAHLDTLRAAGLPVLYYGHDLHFARLGMEAERTADPAIAAKAVAAERLERSIWRRVAVSTYPASDETDRIAAIEPRVVARPLLAFCFDEFHPRTAAPGEAQLMFVGSFRHPPNVAAAEILAKGVFPLVRTAIPDARLVIAGAYPTPGVSALAGDGVEIAGWLSDEALADLYARSRVAVVPLGVGAGIKLKVVEALRNGIPLVTTPVGAQGLPGLEALVPVRDGDDAIAAAVVEQLRLADEAWLCQSKAEQDYARSHFSREAMKRSLVEALELATETRPIE